MIQAIKKLQGEAACKNEELMNGHIQEERETEVNYGQQLAAYQKVAR